MVGECPGGDDYSYVAEWAEGVWVVVVQVVAEAGAEDEDGGVGKDDG